MTKKFPIIATIICLIAIAVLYALGNWQMQRLKWKNQLQAELDSVFSEKRPHLFQPDEIFNLEKGQMLRGIASGRLDLSKSILVHGRIEAGRSVKAVVAPLRLDKSDLTIAIELGCANAPDITAIRAADIPIDVNVVGVLRQPVWSFATPSNDATKDEWWRIDASQLSAQWKVQNLQRPVLTAENSADLIADVTACPIEKHLRNDHLNYATFWFAMAGVLAMMWFLRFLKPYLQSA